MLTNAKTARQSSGNICIAFRTFSSSIRAGKLIRPSSPLVCRTSGSPGACWRRTVCLRRSSIQIVCIILYIQLSSRVPGSYCACRRIARSSASWTRSSAESGEPVNAWPNRRRRGRSRISSDLKLEERPSINTTRTTSETPTLFWRSQQIFRYGLAK